MKRFRPILAIVVALAAVTFAAGCSMPLAAWPEWPTAGARSVLVTTGEDRAAERGYVVLRLYRWNAAGVAEGDRTVRNAQTHDAAFGYRRAIQTATRPDVVTQYELADVRLVPIQPTGLAALPSVVSSGSLWLVAESEKARPGLRARRSFAEIQAVVPGTGISRRAEVAEELRTLDAGAIRDPVRRRQELEFALADLERAAPNAFLAREMIEGELEALRRSHPEAFVPDGVTASKPDVENAP